ncbi:MAG: hypothetical protein E2P01_03800 [Acidobacteria bacterium]|nr:MAG: hypothetical protein E2P01_03800 [Acidobacteriota bacterium]
MYSRKTTWLVAGAVMLVAAMAVAQSDDPFLRSLGKDQPVDRPGLARFMLGTASALENGRDAVAYLKRMAEDAVPGEQFRAKASAAMQERIGAYDEALEQFSSAARRLVEDPGSDRRLFAALVAGQHGCWRLESHINLAESYGANAGQLRGVLSSGSACSKFAHVVFQAKVIALIGDALIDERDEPRWARENRELKEELTALEQLLEDLREIDAE